MFISITDVGSVDLKDADEGYFYGFRQGVGGPTVITRDADGYWFTVLEGDYAFQFGGRNAVSGSSIGLSIAKPRIEVDPTSGYDASAHGKVQIGDVIFNGDKIELATIPRGGDLYDLTRLEMWQGLDRTSSHSIGFRIWRLVIGEGADLKVLWERKPVAA